MKRNLFLILSVSVLMVSLGFPNFQTSVNAQEDNKLITLHGTPNEIFVNAWGILIETEPNISNGVDTKGLDGEIIFKGTKNIKIQYHRYRGTDTKGEDKFELESELEPKDVDPGGLWIKIDFPDGWNFPDTYLIGKQTKLYKIIFVEENVPRAQMMFQIHYPEMDF